MMNRIWTGVVIATVAIALGSCGMARGVADRVNPFGGNNDSDQGEVPSADRRVSLIGAESILEADESLGAGATAPPAARSNAEWPVEGGDAAHAVGHPSLGASVRRAWRRNVGEGSSRQSRVVTPPVVAAGSAFVMDGQGDVSAYGVSDGDRRWTVRLRSDSRRDREARAGGVAYADGRVFATSGYGFVVALDASTGEEIWRRGVAAPMHSPPTVADGRVFATSYDNELYAISASDGVVLWSYRGLAEPARILASASPAVVGEIVLAPFASGEIVALRVENGREIWSQALTSSGRTTGLSSLNDIAGSPVVVGDHVYATSHSGILAALDLRSGEREWERPAGGVSMPWVAGEVIYVATNDAQIAALRRSDGGVYWLTQLPRFENERRRRGLIAWAGPVLAGGRLYLVSSEGDMVALDPQSGDRLQEWNLGESTFIAPVVAQDTLFVLTDDAELIAFR